MKTAVQNTQFRVRFATWAQTSWKQNVQRTGSGEITPEKAAGSNDVF